MKSIITALIFISVMAVGQNNVKIVFIRDGGFGGWAMDFKEFIDGKMVCALDNKSYNILEITPGEHRVTWQPESKELGNKGKAIEVKMNFEADKTYYFEMTIASHEEMNELTESSGKKKIAKLKVDTDCDN